MADRTVERTASDDSEAGRTPRGSTAAADAGGPAATGAPDSATVGAPRWVKAFGAIGLALVAVFLVLQFVGGGQHGPARHGGGAEPTAAATAANPAGDGSAATPPVHGPQSHSPQGPR